MMKFFQDDAGNNSSLRLTMMYMVVCVMTGWLWVVFKTTAIPDIPMGLAGLVGSIFLAKVWQKGTEAK